MLPTEKNGGVFLKVYSFSGIYVNLIKLSKIKKDKTIKLSVTQIKFKLLKIFIKILFFKTLFILYSGELEF